MCENRPTRHEVQRRYKTIAYHKESQHREMCGIKYNAIANATTKTQEYDVQ
jgi:hypothetical protein